MFKAGADVTHPFYARIQELMCLKGPQYQPKRARHFSILSQKSFCNVDELSPGETSELHWEADHFSLVELRFVNYLLRWIQDHSKHSRCSSDCLTPHLARHTFVIYLNIYELDQFAQRCGQFNCNI